MAKLAAATL
jgi:hypothetical protein